jgi:hypothetical protein
MGLGGPGKTCTCICGNQLEPMPAVFHYTTGPPSGAKAQI